MDHLKNTYLLAITIAFVFLLLLHKCGDGNRTTLGNPEVIARDSSGINFHSESTITVIDTFILVSPPKTQYVYLHDTILDTLEVIPNGLDTFTTPIKDSLLEGSIQIISATRPFISFEYKLKTFNTTTTTTIKDSTFSEITEKVRVNQLYFGTSAVVYPGFRGVFIGADFVSKKGWQVEGSIGIDPLSPVQPLGLIGVKKLITFRKRK